MAKTLTVTLADERLSRAEALAAARGLTLQEWLERILAVVTAPPLDRSQLPPHTRKALGMLKGLPDRPYEELLEEALLQKYGYGK